ncbi:hypothetical protein F5887DRAFT_988258, partial [Amanita rubescens]
MPTSASARRVHRDAQNDVHPNGPQIVAPRPIRSLPVEILSQIFILTLHIDFAATAELHETPRHSGRRLQIFNPLVLCAVCSSWRSLAVSTPQLWQRVFIHFPLSLEKAQAEKRAADLIQWIQRARSLPLALHISCNHDLYEGPPFLSVLCTPFLSVINEYRWESLYLQGRFTALQLGPSPNLSLTLFKNDKWHLSLWKIFSPNHENFPWAELTHLREDNRDNYYQTLLMKCPKLVQLSISIPSYSFGAPMVHNLVTFSLKMNFNSCYLLDRITLPSLRDMFIKEVSSRDIQLLLNFFTRSSCSLGKLEVYGRKLSPENLLNLLSHRSCDSLTSLKILEPYHPAASQWKRESVDDHVLQRLALHQNDSLCPHLKFLTLDCATECSQEALLKIVESQVGYLTDQHLPDEPIQYLHLRSIKHLSDVRKLDEVGKGSGMEFTRRRYREADDEPTNERGQYFYSVLLQKQGLQRRQVLVNHGGFFFDLDQE